MARRRRSPTEARDEILTAATALLQAHGPEAVTVTAVADRVGVSHPAVLHHFGSAGGLHEALHARVSAQIRDDLLGLLQTGQVDRRAAIAAAMAQLASPAKGRVMAWLVASGRPMFPPRRERGLATVASQLQPGQPTEELQMRVQLAVLAMIGEAMAGDEVRARLGLCGAGGSERFQAWLLQLLMPPTPPPEEPPEPPQR